MEETPENLKSYLLANFTRMPKDLALLILNKLSTREIINLCSVNKDLHDFCQERNVLVSQARQYIAKMAPLGEPLDDIFKQANAIRRGQMTYYTLTWTKTQPFSNPEVHMGDPSDGMYIKTKYFTIRGSPPPTGTKIWIIGYDNGNGEFDSQPRAQAYSTLKDLENDRSAHHQNDLMDAIDDGYIIEDYEEAIALLAKRFENELAGKKKNWKYDLYKWFIYEVELP
jgi:hypothetical protein